MRRDWWRGGACIDCQGPASLVYIINNTLVSRVPALGEVLLISVIILFSPNLAAEFLEEYLDEQTWSLFDAVCFWESDTIN